MNFLNLIIENKLSEAKEYILNRLNDIAMEKLGEYKKIVAEDTFETIEEASSNVIRMGRIKKIRRRIRRNAKGRIVVQKNVRKSAIKGYRVSGNRVVRIPASVRLKKARLLKRSWKTTRKAKLRRTLMKRKMSMRRRAGLGIK